MNTILELNYAQLMQQAQEATSRQEALHLIHAATRLVETNNHRQLKNEPGR